MRLDRGRLGMSVCPSQLTNATPSNRLGRRHTLARTDAGLSFARLGLVPGVVDMTPLLIGVLSASASITAAITYLIRERMWLRFARWLITEFKDQPGKLLFAAELLRARRGKPGPADPWLLTIADAADSVVAESAVAANPEIPVRDTNSTPNTNVAEPESTGLDKADPTAVASIREAEVAQAEALLDRLVRAVLLALARGSHDKAA